MGLTEKATIFSQQEIKRSSSMFISKQMRGCSGKTSTKDKNVKLPKALKVNDRI
jgi:hypothetical protein